MAKGQEGVKVLTPQNSRRQSAKASTGICTNCQKKTGKMHVHHRDENPLNNEPSNLMTLCVSCHSKAHSPNYNSETMMRKPCAHCETPAQKNGLCNTHLSRLNRYGHPLAKKIKQGRDWILMLESGGVLSSFPSHLEKTDVSDDCAVMAMQSFHSVQLNSSKPLEGQLKICTECSEQKPLAAFTFDKRRGRHAAKCTCCRTKKTKQWRDRNPDYEKDRYGDNEDRDRWRHIKRKYGISKEEYLAMLSDQGGVCAICGDAPGERYSHQLHVDHCHSTGKIRGLLCRGCNHMLGVVKDDELLLFKAAEYLRKSPQNSSKHLQEPLQVKVGKVKILAGSFEHDGWLLGAAK